VTGCARLYNEYIYKSWLVDSMEPSPSWEAHRPSANEECPRIQRLLELV